MVLILCRHFPPKTRVIKNRVSIEVATVLEIEPSQTHAIKKTSYIEAENRTVVARGGN